MNDLPLREAPFGATPDPAFFYPAPTRLRALEALLAALERGEPLVKLTGEAGSGKTSLCRRLIESLDPKAWAWVFLTNGGPEPRALTLAIARGLGAQVDGPEGGAEAMRSLGLRLLALARTGRRALVVVDEAQAMSDEALEALRRLTNLETAKRKLVQVLLCGERELDRRLAAPGLLALRQRIGFELVLEPLGEDEVGKYIEHRIRAAGHSGEGLLTRGGVRTLVRLSHGLPRLVNQLAEKSLATMREQGARRVSAAHVRMAAAQTPALPPGDRVAERRHEWFWRSVAVLLLAGVLWTTWVAYQLSPRELATPQAFAAASSKRFVSAPVRRPADDAATASSKADPSLLRSLELPAAKVLAYPPDFAVALARIHLHREDYGAALAVLDAARNEASNTPDYYRVRGTVLRGLNQHDLADAAFRRAEEAAASPAFSPSAPALEPPALRDQAGGASYRSSR
ncbi:MAG TPA: AAA family ATPase [Burkholderiales bacterium]|nr:AAA family ATPase [Burkholderiales bacterium]